MSQKDIETEMIQTVYIICLQCNAIAIGEVMNNDSCSAAGCPLSYVDDSKHSEYYYYYCCHIGLGVVHDVTAINDFVPQVKPNTMNRRRFF